MELRSHHPRDSAINNPNGPRRAIAGLGKIPWPRRVAPEGAPTRSCVRPLGLGHGMRQAPGPGEWGLADEEEAFPPFPLAPDTWDPS